MHSAFGMGLPRLSDAASDFIFDESFMPNVVWPTSKDMGMCTCIQWEYILQSGLNYLYQLPRFRSWESDALKALEAWHGKKRSNRRLLTQWTFDREPVRVTDDPRSGRNALSYYTIILFEICLDQFFLRIKEQRSAVLLP